MTEREAKKLDQLQKADESLAADQRSLDDLLAEIGELLNSEMADKGDKGEGDSPMPGEAKSPEQPPSPPNGEPKNAQGEPTAAPEQPRTAYDVTALTASWSAASHARRGR